MVYWFPSVPPSVRPASRVRSVAPTVLVGSISYLYTSYQGTSEGMSNVKSLTKFQNLNFWQFFKICNFDFVLFWLGIWCDSLVWVIMGRRGVYQNAGILIVLVGLVITYPCWDMKFIWLNFNICKCITLNSILRIPSFTQYHSVLCVSSLWWVDVLKNV